MRHTSTKLRKLKEKVNTLPRTSGIYKFKDAHGEIIYVGKAKDLKNRVGSYFSDPLDDGSKTAALVQRVYDIVIIETFSEFEALILEAELIKKHKPKYNIQL